MQVFSFLKKAMSGKALLVAASMVCFLLVVGVQEGSAQSIKHVSQTGSNVKAAFASKTVMNPDDAMNALTTQANTLRNAGVQTGVNEATTPLRIVFFDTAARLIASGDSVEDAVINAYGRTLLPEAANYNQTVVTTAKLETIFNEAVDLVTL